MNTEVKLHPSTELLNQFVQGELATGKSVVVSAHLELCKYCSAKAKELQALAVSSWVDPGSVLQSDQSSEADYSSMVAGIVTSPQVKSEPVDDLVDVDIDVLDRSIKLPKVLAKAASQGLKWKKVAGGISEAQLFIDNETQCEFIYMAPGCKVPVHTHQAVNQLWCWMVVSKMSWVNTKPRTSSFETRSTTISRALKKVVSALLCWTAR